MAWAAYRVRRISAKQTPHGWGSRHIRGACRAGVVRPALEHGLHRRALRHPLCRAVDFSGRAHGGGGGAVRRHRPGHASAMAGCARRHAQRGLEHAGACRLSRRRLRRHRPRHAGGVVGADPRSAAGLHFHDRQSLAGREGDGGAMAGTGARPHRRASGGAEPRLARRRLARRMDRRRRLARRHHVRHALPEALLRRRSTSSPAISFNM